MDVLGNIFQGAGAAFAGGAAASGWTVAVIFANIAFDGLDYNRADRMLRRTLLVSSNFQAILLGIAAVFSLLSGSIVAFITCLITALGFLSNVWTLAPRSGKRVTGMRENRKGKRMVAVALTLIQTAFAALGAALVAFGI
ncbi:hypothetical protein [Hirschia litorea]|uniref:Uncharacterized protein n=1 Tax=Hirschia litorea TaxID=1199156 RepID=A0ABW2IMM7_9PROT